MSHVLTAGRKTTLLDMLMEEHGASGVTTASVVQEHLNLSTQERAAEYRKKYLTLRQNLTTVEQALAQPQSSGLDSIT